MQYRIISYDVENLWELCRPVARNLNICPECEKCKMATLTENLQQLLNLNAGTAEILASILLFAFTAVVGWDVLLCFQ